MQPVLTFSNSLHSPYSYPEPENYSALLPTRPVVDKYDNYLFSDEEFSSRSGTEGTVRAMGEIATKWMSSFHLVI
jgi:hypothetical protein